MTARDTAMLQAYVFFVLLGVGIISLLVIARRNRRRPRHTAPARGVAQVPRRHR